MPSNPLAQHAPHRQIAVIAVVVPLLVALALSAFTWSTARLAPRDLPVGLVGAAGTPAAAALDAQGDALDVHHYGDAAAARTAIRDRDVYGAVVVSGRSVSLLVASAASPSVAQQLTAVGERLGGGRAVPTLDVVPFASDDPRGLTLTSSILPLVFGGQIVAVVIALLLGLRPAWRQVFALTAVSATTGLAALLITQGWLGALPGNHWATWAALSALVLAVGATIAGLYALIGPPGIGLGAVLMIFVGNPFSGVTSAPDLLPRPVGTLGQWLPPGAGGSLLRDAAYFGGHDAAGHAWVLAAWIAGGIGAIVLGHRRASRKGHGDHQEATGNATPDLVGAG